MMFLWLYLTTFILCEFVYLYFEFSVFVLVGGLCKFYVLT